MIPPRRPSFPTQPSTAAPRPAQRPAPAAPMGGPISQGAPARRPAPAPAPVQQQQRPAPVPQQVRHAPAQNYQGAPGAQQQRRPAPAPSSGAPPAPRPAPVQQQAPASVAPQPQYHRPPPAQVDQTGWADLGPGVRGKVNAQGQIMLVLTPSPTPDPSKNGKADILASTGGGWARLDNLLGPGHALNLALTRRRGRGPGRG